MQIDWIKLNLLLRDSRRISVIFNGIVRTEPVTSRVPPLSSFINIRKFHTVICKMMDEFSIRFNPIYLQVTVATCNFQTPCIFLWHYMACIVTYHVHVVTTEDYPSTSRRNASFGSERGNNSHPPSLFPSLRAQRPQARVIKQRRTT